MKVSGPSGPAASSPSRPARGAAGGFSVGAGGQAAPSAATSAAASVGSVADVSALMALQGVETATERRRRAIRRGGTLLDRLDDLKLALLEERSGAPALERLSRNLREERPDAEDEGLNGLLRQIDLRAAVELAKAERAAAS